MTGEVLSGIGSSAAILYYNDTVTYEDGTSEPMQLTVLPLPHVAGKQPRITQAGVGLCAYKTTSQKAEAAAVFVKWLTEPQRNLDFACEAGYMPVTNGAFDEIDVHTFRSDAYRALYTALKAATADAAVVSEQQSPDYYSHVYAFYDMLRTEQKSFGADRDAAATAADLWRRLGGT